MKRAPAPRNETARIAALRHYSIVEMPSDAVLDSIVRAAGNLCETPIALISLVDSTRLWFKSCFGMTVSDTSRDHAFCNHAILEPNRLLEVEDASQDKRFREYSLVTGEPNSRFYAGRPLVTPEGFALGTLCVIDTIPRRLSDSQREGLKQLNNAVIELFRERLGSRIKVIDHIVEQTVQGISERQRQEENVRLRERAIEALDVGVTIIDATQEDNPLVYVNQTLCTMTGYSSDELIGQGAGMLQKNNHQQLQHLEIKAAQAKGESVQVLFKSTRKDGSRFMNDLSLSPVHSAEGKLTHYIGINRDVTEKLENEERSQRSRKIEAIGQLAGGIAHDFNNLLSVITGNLEFVTMDTTNHEHREHLNKADSAAKMGARLTRRLLSFARQGQLEPTVLNANEHVLTAVELLRSTIGEHITLSSKLSDELWNILADSSEIENTVVNLVINARDAMPKGGTITIETKNVTFTEKETENAFGITPGDYIKLSVSDTGCGMNDEIKSRVFEPFFTTKEASAGLGLASILGFAQQSGGDVHVYSSVDKGAVINVYLPGHFKEVADKADVRPADVHSTSGAVRIMVVEDNDMVRELTVERLHALGYETRQASDGPKAIQILKDDSAFELILTDIVMEGGMSGFDVAQWVQSHLPGSNILLTSGFNEQTAEASDVDVRKLRVLQKPYSLAELQQRIDVILENTGHCL